jgi:tetratricopeptide (TPR) repeat protein
MSTNKTSQEIDDLIDREEWGNARALIEKELAKAPNDHWLLTQLAETYYEQRRYKKALELLLKSRAIGSDCPLTLWHLAGTLDALEYHTGAIRIFSWLLKSKRSAEDDPCWESKEWTDALKTDCVYRIGVCYQHLGRKDKAKPYFQRYIAILSAGALGSYPIEDAMRRIRELQSAKPEKVQDELRKAVNLVSKSSANGTRATKHPPRLDAKKLRELQEA